jgi:hypothetical protein
MSTSTFVRPVATSVAALAWSFERSRSGTAAAQFSVGVRARHQHVRGDHDVAGDVLAVAGENGRSADAAGTTVSRPSTA